MRSIVLTLSIGLLAGGLVQAFAQSSPSQPNPVISSPGTVGTSDTTGAPSTSSNPAPTTTGGRLSTAVGALLGKVLGRDQSQLTFDQLPQPVQNTVRSEAGTAPLGAISQISTNGQPAYLVTFNRNGQDVNLQIDPSGRLLNRAGTAPVLAADWRSAPVRQPLQQVTPVAFDQLPQPVRDAFLRYAGAGPVDRPEQGVLGGHTVYQAALQPNGQTINLRLADNGELINDQVNVRFLADWRNQQSRNSAAGSYPVSQTGQGTETAPLSNPTSVTFDQLPLAVQTTLSGQVGDAAINTITQGTLEGRTAYELTYNKQGRPVTLRLADDGSLLSSPATTTR